MPLVLFTTGLLSVLAQVVLLRELSVASFGSELPYVLGIGLWLALTGMGAAAVDRFTPTVRRIAFCVAVTGALVPVAVALARSLRLWFGALPGAYQELGEQIAAIAIVLGPVAIALGALFSWPARLYIQNGGTAARAYAAESAGGLAGGALSTLLLAAGVQNFTSATVTFLLGGAAGLAPVLLLPRTATSVPAHERRPPFLRRIQRTSAWAMAPAIALTLYVASGIDRALTARVHPNVVKTRDSAYGRLTMTRDRGQVVVFVNDALAFESQGVDAEAFVTVVGVQHPAPQRILVLGGGVTGLTAEALRFAPAALDDVELDPLLFDVVLPELPPELRTQLLEPPVRRVIADPRRFLDDADLYDLILVGMPEPDSGQANRFFTEEFFDLCAAHLAPGGVVGLRLRGAENRWTPVVVRKIASVARAMRAALRDVLAIPGDPVLLIGGNAALSRDPSVLAGRLAHLTPAPRLVTFAYLRYLFENDRFAELEHVLATTTVEPNSDARPLGFHYALLGWLERIAPALMGLDPRALARERGGTGVLGLLALLGIGLLVIARKWRRIRSSVLVALAGFAGMVFETALVLNYQVKRGVLFQDLGLLLMIFMAGLTAGTLLAERWRSPKRFVAGLGALLAVASLWAAFGSVEGLGTTLALLALGGGFTGGAFAIASIGAEAAGRTGRLYAADLAGGAFGAVVSGLVLVPAFGLPATLASTAALAIAALVLL